MAKRERDYLSELEQLLLLTVLHLGDEAYGARIRKTLAESVGRSVSIATIYVSLGRLEERGLVRSWMSEPVAVRGGRSRRFFAVEEAGVEALEKSRRTFEQMWALAWPGERNGR